MHNQPESLFITQKRLILASASPRRGSMLNQLGIRFETVPADIDETPFSTENPKTFARRMARDKAMTVARDNPDSWVIGADTVVSLENSLLGKPVDPADAMAMLKRLAGKSHQVLTGYCLCCRAEAVEETGVAVSRVTFNTCEDNVLQAYVNTGEPLDKAGAYGIQAMGGFLVRRVEGSCTNVIGLPLDIVVRLLLRYRIVVPKIR